MSAWLSCMWGIKTLPTAKNSFATTVLGAARATPMGWIPAVRLGVRSKRGFF